MERHCIVRKIDQLGRIVLPKELRNLLCLEPFDSVRIYIKDRKIIIESNDPLCYFCSSSDDLIEYENRYICRSCLDKLAKENL